MIWVFVTVCGVQAAADDYFLRGIVRDSITDDPLPGVYVALSSSSRGTMSDKDGIFELTVPSTAKSLTVRCLGYESKVVQIAKNRVNLYAVYLIPSQTELDEVVVKRANYTKKNNPAVDLMQHIRRTADRTNPEKQPYYSYSTYQRSSLALNNIDLNNPKNLLSRSPFLMEHIDTSEITGKPVLPVSVREQSARVYVRSRPQAKHTVVTGKRSDGIDEMLDAESMDRFMNDILGPIDIYARDINLLQNRFVSPLSPIAADFYKFYITDSLTDSDGHKYYVLSFYPHNKSAFGFTGTMEVTSLGDTSAFVRKVDMRVPSEINLNFIESLVISQTFGRHPNGSRIPLRDDMTIEASIIPGAQGFYAHRVIDYSDHTFDRPEKEYQIFMPKASITTVPEATRRDSVFWQQVNPTGMSRGESRVGNLLTRFRQNKVFYWGEKLLRILVTGYIATGPDSKFDIGPMNTTISANPLEGLRLRAGGITTANLNPRLFARLYGAYGFKDHKWKYGLELEYSFYDKERHTREFPVHSLRLSSIYDVDRPGQQYAFTNPDNVFLSLHRPGLDPMTYHRLQSLLYTLELETHFSVQASVRNERLYESSQMRFNLSGGGSIPHFDVTSAEVEFRFAPNEKFYQTTTNRIPINMDHPVVALTQTFAPRGLGNFSPVNATRVTYRQRFWFSAFGYLDVLAKAGHVWSHGTPFNHLFIANTNLSYTIQPESFALTAPMEFVADSYANLQLTYWLNGALLNLVPGVKKLKLREVLSLNTFYGSLSRHNDPARMSGLILWPGCQTVSQRLHTPYLEASVGLDNILRCLRVDYVWRLTHRASPMDGAQRWGIRIAFHPTF